jgi:hypothetical protein
VKYERPAKEMTKVRRQTTEMSDIGRFVIDETAKPMKKAKREPHVGRIEEMEVEDKSKQNGDFPLEPHIGSLLIKSAPVEEDTYEVSFSF